MGGTVGPNPAVVDRNRLRRRPSASPPAPAPGGVLTHVIRKPRARTAYRSARRSARLEAMTLAIQPLSDLPAREARVPHRTVARGASPV